MNHPTTEVDELLSLANEALEDGDTVQALQALRSAGRLAPLRKDIKNEIARILEGSLVPSSKSPAKKRRMQPVQEIDLPDTDTVSFKDTLEEVAQKAFKFASEGTTATTSKLTNLVSEGLKSLRFSHKNQISDPAARFEKQPIEFGDQTILNSNAELNEYLEREAEYYDDEELAEEEQLASNTKMKSPRSGKKPKPARAVEDVLSDKMFQTFQQLAAADRIKLGLTASYIALLVFTGFACYKVGQTFPAIRMGGAAVATETINLDAVSSTSPGSNVTALVLDTDPLQEANALLAAGNTGEAITVLQSSLSAGLPKATLTNVSSELSKLLAQRGADNLKTNKFQESIADYRKALELDPHNHTLMLHLGNALYYAGIRDPKSGGKKVLQEAAKNLEAALIYDKSNHHGYSILASTYQELGDKTKSRQAWQKVLDNPKASSEQKKTAKENLSK